MKNEAGRGRRKGSPDTREAIRLAARERFLADGFQGVTLRAIAGDAGVDVALVSYYFGSKQGLFAQALALPVNPIEVVDGVLAGDRGSLAERLLRTFLAVWDDPQSGGALQAIAAAATHEPNLNRLVREAVGREIIARLAEQFGGGEDGERRAAAFTTQMAGLVLARYLLALEPIASLSPDDIVALLGPGLQAIVDPTIVDSGT